MTVSAEELLHATGSRRRLPDFFIVGHPKCGTTALYEMLRRHPRIYMPDLKEPWYFASDMRPRFQPARTGETPDTLESYAALFASATPEQRVGEASSSYLSSHTAAERIAEVCGGARVVAIVREPASFLCSLHLQLLRDHVETERDFGRALALEQARAAGAEIPRRSHLPQLLRYSEHVRYVQQLRRYHALFPAERVQVLIYEDFRANNAATVRAVLRFLEVDEEVALAPITANRTTGRMRSQRLEELLNTVAVGRGPASRAVKATVKTLTPSGVRGAAMRGTRRHVIYGKAKRPDEELMLALRRRLKPEVVALSEYLERDLVTLWGYDRLT
ncbi:MAG TPA: sulfotransferase [Solirubrobacteraceae bacterium]|nr:sulfotransferase [Solirubrobacteraceae bacterium]